MTKPPRPPVAPPPPAAFGDRLADFAPLSPAEMKLRDACRTGDVAIYGDAKPEKKTKARLVRAAVLRVFCLGRDPAAPVHAHGVRIVGAWIDGALDLEGVAVPHPLIFLLCRFDDTITLRDATTRQLAFGESSCPGLEADRLVTHGGLFLRALETAGTVSLMGATISGDLDCAGATFAEGQGHALACDRAEIAGSVFLNGSLTAHREVRLLGATIGGSLDCSGATFAEGQGHALACDGAEIAGAVFLNGGFTAHREVRFHSATIGDNLDCSGATLADGQGVALVCDGAEIAGSVVLNGGFTAHREVRFLDATIGGNLDCSGATFAVGEGKALACDRAKLVGSVFLSDEFIAHREVRFLGATIGGDFGCRQCRFEASAPLVLDKATVTGTLFLDEGFHAAGFVILASATIGDLIDAPDAWAKPTWILDGLTYRRFAGKAPAEAMDRIRWLDRQLPEHLIGPDFRPQPWEQCAKVLAEMGHEADAVRVRIEKRRRMRALPLHRAKTGTKKRRLTAALVHAVRRPGWAATCAVPAALATYGAALLRQGLVRLGIFSDWLLDKSVGYGWRPQWALGWLVLLWGLTAGLHATAVPKGVMAPTDALVYQSPAIPPECRIDWLEFAPPPGLGDLDRRADLASRLELSAHVPDRPETHGPPTPASWKEICGRAMPAEYTTFSPWVYALDVLLPIVDLRQEKDWSPRVTDADGDVIAPLFTKAEVADLLAWEPESARLHVLWTHGPGWVWRNGVLFLQYVAADWGWGYLTRLMEWAMILAGWGLSGMLLGAVTGVIRRE